MAGVLTPPSMALSGIPSGVFGGETPNVTAQAWVLGIELGLVWLAGVWILVTHVRRRDADEPEPMTPFARIYPAVYLAGMAVLWLAALPGVPRRRGRHHQRRHADRQRALHARLLRRRGRGAGRAPHRPASRSRSPVG